jgi:hypothetical protein
VTEAICANGRTIGPQIIIPGAVVLEKYVVPELNSGVLLCCSPEGYTNDATKDHTTSVFRLLLSTD